MSVAVFYLEKRSLAISLRQVQQKHDECLHIDLSIQFNKHTIEHFTF